MTDKPTIPAGWREMAPDELVIKGDQCYVYGRFWLSDNWLQYHSGKQHAGCRPYIRRIEQPQSAWIPVNPALGGRLPTEADGVEASKDGGKCVLVEDRFGQLKVVPWNAAGFDNGYLPDGASFVRWHRLPAPYAPPEPEKRDHRIIKDGGIERRYVEERDGDPDPDAARELVDYIVTRSKYAPCDWIRLLELAAKCRRTDDEAG